MSIPKLNQTDTSLKPNVLPKRFQNRRPFFKSWLNNARRKFYLSLKRLKGKPTVLARGTAVGVFAGCFPFFGLQSLIGVVLATIFKGSRVAAVACTWISNPLTYIPLFVFNFNVGKLLLGVESISGRDIDFESLASFRELGSTFAISLLAGSFVVGTIASVIAYFARLTMFQRLQYRKSRRKKPSSSSSKHSSARFR